MSVLGIGSSASGSRTPFQNRSEELSPVERLLQGRKNRTQQIRVNDYESDERFQAMKAQELKKRMAILQGWAGMAGTFGAMNVINAAYSAAESESIEFVKEYYKADDEADKAAEEAQKKEEEAAKERQRIRDLIADMRKRYSPRGSRVDVRG